MRLRLMRSGGVANVRRPPLELDTQSRPPAEGTQLHELLSRAGFFALPAELGTPGAQPDVLGYELTVTDDDGRSHSVSFDMSAAPPELREVMSIIRNSARPG